METYQTHETKNEQWVKRISSFSRAELTAMTNFEFYREIISEILIKLGAADRKTRTKKTKEEVIEFCLYNRYIENPELNEIDNSIAWVSYCEGYSKY